MQSQEKKIAVSRLKMSDGRVLKNQILVFKNGAIDHFYPLSEEEAFTSWYGGEILYEDLLNNEKSFSMY